MFHLTHGIFFEKLPDGWVRVTKRETENLKSKLIFQVAMDRDAWTNVVNAMAGEPERIETPIENGGENHEPS